MIQGLLIELAGLQGRQKDYSSLIISKLTIIIVTTYFIIITKKNNFLICLCVFWEIYVNLQKITKSIIYDTNWY